MTRTYSKEQLDAMIAEGLTGPAGPTGSAGPAGPTGSAGPVGLFAAIPVTDYQDLEGTLDATLTQAGNTFEAHMPAAGEVNLTCNVITAGAGELRAQYSTDGTTWNYLSATGTGPSVSLATTGLKDSGWIEIASGAKTSVRLRLITISGTGATVSIDGAVVRVRGGGTVSTTDHNTLANRSVANQHPALAITNTPAGEITSTDLQGTVNELAALIRISPPEVSVTPTAATITLTSTAFGKLHVFNDRTTGGPTDYTVALPACAGNARKVIGLEGAPGLTKLITLDGNASETVDAALTLAMWAREVLWLKVKADESGYAVVGGRSRAKQRTLFLSSGTPGTAFATSSGGADALVPCATIVSDPTGFMADTTNKRINIKRTSSYDVFGQVGWANLTANIPRILSEVFKNGTALKQSESNGVTGGYPTPQVFAQAAPLVASDYVDLRCWRSGGGATEYVYGATGVTFISIRENIPW